MKIDQILGQYAAGLSQLAKQEDRLRDADVAEAMAQAIQLIDRVRSMVEAPPKTTNGWDASDRRSFFAIALSPEAEANYVDALARANELVVESSGYEASISQRWSFICLDFLATNDFKKAHDPQMRKRYLYKLEMAMNIKLIGG